MTAKIQKVESDVNNVNKEVCGKLYGKALNENKTEPSVKTVDTQRLANNSKKLADIVKNWEDKDQWHIVEHKKKPRPAPKFGTRNATSGTGKSLKAAKDKRTWHLYVGNLPCGTDADQVREFLTDNNVEVMTCEGVGTGHWENRPVAFHVEVVYDMKDTIMMESFWDKGEKVRNRTFLRKKKDEWLFAQLNKHCSHELKLSSLIFLYSFNMFGFNHGELFLKNNLRKYDLCCVQEHWLYPSTLNDLANFNPDFTHHAVSQMSNDDLLSPGRPHDGLAVFWKKKLSLIVHYVGSSPNNRVINGLCCRVY